MIVSLYVDDFVITGNNVDLILGLKKQLDNTFDMTDLRLLHFFMGIQILQIHDGIFLCQPKYVTNLLKLFKMDESKSCATHFQLGIKLTKECESPRVDVTLYRHLVGILIYLSRNWLDILFVINVASLFMQNPWEIHWKVANIIIRYIKGNHQFGIKIFTVVILLSGLLTLIVLTTMMKKNPLMVMCFNWDLETYGLVVQET